MIGRIGGGREVNPTAGEAYGCFFFIIMPIISLLTGLGWFGFVSYIVIGIAIPTIPYWWKQREERKWNENELWSIFDKLERSKYSKLTVNKERDIYTTQDVDGDYQISEIQFDSKILELIITVIDYRDLGLKKVIRLDELNCVRVCKMQEIPHGLINMQVIHICDVRIGPYKVTGYLGFE